MHNAATTAQVLLGEQSLLLLPRLGIELCSGVEDVTVVREVWIQIALAARKRILLELLWP